MASIVFIAVNQTHAAVCCLRCCEQRGDLDAQPHGCS
jgi:hypothetical protein